MLFWFSHEKKTREWYGYVWRREEEEEKEKNASIDFIHSRRTLCDFFLLYSVEIGEKIDIEVFIIQEKQREKKLESGLFVRMFIANIWKIIHM